MSAPDHRAVILVVDDTPANLAFLTDALSEAGYRVLVALDGQEALERLAIVPPDIILLDAMMPVMDGFEACGRIKSHPCYRDIPIIFMTALGEPEHICQGLRLGAVDYVIKPVHPEELKARIKNHLTGFDQLRLAKRALVATGEVVIAIRSDGAFAYSHSRAQEWLPIYFPDTPEGLVPDAVRSWVSQQFLSGARVSSSQIYHQKDRRLMLQCVGLVENIAFIVMREEDPERLQATWVRQFHLSAREAEVSFWLSRGKTNHDIADILCMSHRTVNKHLEHIFTKLGVETRSAATALILAHNGHPAHNVLRSDLPSTL